MNISNDRRAPGTTRIPFDAMVEVGGALGPSFEAQAVNVSGEGMSLRTAYLPEIGQPVTCRFDPGRGAPIVAAGEVVWNEDRGDGGEFGIRFTKLDANGTAALQRVLGVTGAGGAGGAGTIGSDGRKIRLHIEGLASPMRARAKGAASPERVKAYSELGFLQLGRALDVEDATTGQRRPASVDRVDVEIQAESRVPQLVVSLRYEDEEARAAAMGALEASPVVSIAEDVDDDRLHDDRLHDGREEIAEDEAAYAAGADDDDTFGDEEEDVSPEGDFADDEEHDSFEDEVRAADPIRGSMRLKFDSSADAVANEGGEDTSPDFKERWAHAAGKISPAVEKWASRAKSTAVLFAQRALARKGRDGKGGDDARSPQRRTTAPAPGGGLHTSGRKVVRGSGTNESTPPPAKKLGLPVTKKHLIIGGSTALAVFVGALAFHSPEKPAPVAIESTPVETTPAALPAAPIEPAPVTPAPMPAPVDPLARNTSAPMPVDDSMMDAPASTPARKKVASAPASFGSGRVGSGNVLRLKMDGDIERIHGASQPTGFTVVLPNRKSLEAAAPLASRDARIATMKVLNEDGGAELSVSFKDGVPNYLVRAKGDTLEIVLAREGQTGERAPEAHVTKKKTRSHTKKRR